MKSIEQMKYELRSKLLKALPESQIIPTIHGPATFALDLRQIRSDIDEILGEFFDEHKPKKTVTTYSIVCESNTATFLKAINQATSQGWKPHGNLVIRNSHELVQLMVKETEVQF